MDDLLKVILLKFTLHVYRNTTVDITAIYNIRCFILHILKVCGWLCQLFSLLGKEAPDWLNKECSDWLDKMVHLDWLDMGCLDWMEMEQFDWLIVA